MKRPALIGGIALALLSGGAVLANIDFRTPRVDSRVTLRAAAFAVDRDLPLHNLQKVDSDVPAPGLSLPRRRGDRNGSRDRGHAHSQ